jgi:hypothetical protein
VTAADILKSVDIVSRCLDHAPGHVLEAAYQMVHDHFLEVTERTSRSLEEAAEQRVCGTLLAEIEMAIHRRSNR